MNRSARTVPAHGLLLLFALVATAPWARGLVRDEHDPAGVPGPPAGDGIEALEGMLAREPDDVQVARDLARAYLDAGRTAEALTLATRLLDLAAEPEDRLLVARCSLAEADRQRAAGASSRGLDSLLSDAEHQSRLAADARPDDPEARVLHAFSLFRIERLHEAMDELDRVVSRWPDDAEGLGLRGYMRLETGDATGALEDLDRAVRSSPDRADLRIHRARALAAGDPTAAAEALVETIERGLADDAFARDAYEILAGRADLGIRVLTRFVRADATRSRGWYWLGRAQSDAGLHSAAAESFSRALAIDPDDVSSLAYRANALANAGDLAGMEAELVAVLRRAPDGPDRAWALLRAEATVAWYVEHGRWEDSVRLARELSTASPDEPRHRVALAMGLSRLGREDEAHATLVGALEAFPEDPVVLNGLGLFHLGLGALAEAESAFGRASELGSLDATENLAVLLLDGGRVEDAIPRFRTVLDAAPWRIRSLAGLDRALHSPR